MKLSVAGPFMGKGFSFSHKATKNTGNTKGKVFSIFCEAIEDMKPQGNCRDKETFFYDVCFYKSNSE